MKTPSTEPRLSARRPEQQLLICVARRALDESAAVRMRSLLVRKLDWDYVLRLANQHGMIQLLYHHLNSVPAGVVPEQVMSQLQHDNNENTRSNLFLTGELLKVLQFLEANDIQAIPFKGPTLALLAYGDLGLRQFADLDLLVQKRDFLRVKELLARRDFKPWPELTSTQEFALLRFDCAHNFDNGQGVVLDVHWNFVERYLSSQVDPRPLWDRLKQLSLGGKEVFTFSPEDLLIILCLHGFTHSWDRLGWICDIAGLIDRQNDIDWQTVMQRAAKIGAGRILWLGLFLANELLKAPLTKEVSTTVRRDPQVRRFGEWVKEHLFAEARSPLGIVNEAAMRLSMRERRRDKMKSFFTLIVTPRRYDWEFVSLPTSLSFLYYLIRPVRLAGKYGSRLLSGGAGPAISAKRSGRALS